MLGGRIGETGVLIDLGRGEARLECQMFWISGLLSQYFGFLDGTIDGQGRPGGNG